MPGLNGLVVMTPTSIASTGTGNSSSIGANGKVTFSSCATLSLNGVFTSSYDNYMIVLRGNNSVGSNNLYFRYRASGTDNSTASSYVGQRLRANSTTVDGIRSTDNQAQFIEIYTTTRWGANFFCFGPYLAQPTASRAVNVTALSSAAIHDYAVTHNQSVSYDGITLYTDGGDNVTGAITVYGFNQ